jgi:predicted Zn-dependent protease
MALNDMHKALKHKKSPTFFTSRAVVHLCLGDAPSAMTDLRSAINLDPTYSLAYTNAVHVYLRRRQLAQAITYCDTIVGLTPTDETAYANRAIARCLTGIDGDAVDQALADCDTAIKLSPGSAYLHYNRAMLLIHVERWSEAETDLRHYTTIVPTDPDGHSQLAKALGHQEGKAQLALQSQAISTVL